MVTHPPTIVQYLQPPHRWPLLVPPLGRHCAALAGDRVDRAQVPHLLPVFLKLRRLLGEIFDRRIPEEGLLLVVEGVSVGLGGALDGSPRGLAALRVHLGVESEPRSLVARGFLLHKQLLLQHRSIPTLEVDLAGVEQRPAQLPPNRDHPLVSVPLAAVDGEVLLPEGRGVSSAGGIEAADEVDEGLLPRREVLPLRQFLFNFIRHKIIAHSFIKLVNLHNLGIYSTRESSLLLVSIFSQSLCFAPTYICRGRLIRFVFSFIISHQCAIHPTLRETAKSTVNMSLGMPMALYTIPVQKSTLGYSFLLMKQSSARAYFYRLMARSSSGFVSLSWMVSSTEQHIFCMMVARGSKFLQTRWPKPISRKLDVLSLDLSIISLIDEPSFRISSSMFSTASLAPPWQGPQSEPMPAAMQAKGLAWELPAILTVEVEAFCSCSAWQIQITSSARMTSSSISKVSLMGLENIMQRKFFMYPKCFLGQTMGSPMAVRQAQAARVGILAISLMAISCRSLGLKRSQSECRKAESAPTTPTIMAMGCASLRKPLQNSIIFSLIIISPVTTSSNLPSSLLEGSSPQSSRQHVSIQVECSARSWILYPRYSSSPCSPLMWQMLEMQLAVHMKPGSQVSRFAWESSDRTSMRSCPSEPLRMGSSYSLSPTFRMAFCYCGAGSTGLTSDKSSLSLIIYNKNSQYVGLHNELHKSECINQ